MMENVGHAVFWNDAPAFNQSLRAFCEGIGQTTIAGASS
jgi:hypothetical protein